MSYSLNGSSPFGPASHLPFDISAIPESAEKFCKFFFQDSKGFQIEHRISLNTDGNAICDAQTRETWLHIAAKIQHEVMLSGFVCFSNSPLNLEVRDKENYTPLMLAIKEEKEKSVAILLDAGADIHALSETCGSALHLAAKTSLRIMQVILQKREGSLNFELEDSKKATPLFYAFRNKKLDIAQMLILQQKVDVNHCSEAYPPISAAIETGDTQMVKLLLEQGAKIIEHDRYGFGRVNGDIGVIKITQTSPTITAAMSGNKEMVQLLLDAGDNPHLVSSDNRNAVNFAARNPDSGVLELLLSKGVNPNLQETELCHHTPLFDANSSEHIDLLLKHGANPNILDKSNKSPLFALSVLDVKNIRNFLDHGANPQLHFGIFADYQKNHRDCVDDYFIKEVVKITRLFLERGAKLDGKIRRSLTESYAGRHNFELQQLIKDNSSCVIM